MLSPTEVFYMGVDVVGALFGLVTLTPKRERPPMSETETLEQRVHAMLDDAIANEYDILSWPADDIVIDLLAYTDLTETAEELHPHVITWKIKRGVVT